MTYKKRKAERILLIGQNNVVLKKIGHYALRVIFGCEIPSTVKFGEGLQLIHNGLGVVIHPQTVIGNNCKIYQNVTIGGNGKIVDGITQGGAPIIEDNVAIFSRACVLGPITIGHDSYIGANAVVTKDVPAYSLAFGNPCRITKRKYDINFEG